MTDLLEAKPTCLLLDHVSSKIIGVEYRWNTGEISILWRGIPVDDYIRVPIVQSSVADD